MIEGLASGASAAAEVLWHDPAPYARRQHKLTNARTAIALALERRESASAADRELVAFLGRVETVEPEISAAVWSEPAAYHWIRTTYDLTAVVLGGADRSPAVTAYLEAVGITDTKAALERLADDHKLLALAFALRSERDIAFARPWSTALPVAIPATEYVLSGDGPAQIHGIRDGRLDVSHAGLRGLVSASCRQGEDPAAMLQRCPTVHIGDHGLRLCPEGFLRPGMEMGVLFSGIPAGFQAEHAALLERTLSLIARHHPDTIAHCRAMMRLVVLKPAIVGETSNLSHSDFPGSMALSVVHDPYWLADALIHEVHHNRLFYIEEISRFFADRLDNLMLRSEYYSPWREEPRPLHGILHAIYVNLPLWDFWHDVRRADLSSERNLLADGQLVQIPLQLEIAVRQMERHARFSAFGEFLFAQLAAEVRCLRQKTRSLGLHGEIPATRADIDGTLRAFEPQPDGRPTTVRDLVLTHIRKYDRAAQCTDLQGRSKTPT